MPILVFLITIERASCINGDVRLVGGKIDQEGRVEACSNGVWGPVCGKGFDDSDAYVVCKELGYGTVCKLQHEPIISLSCTLRNTDPTVYTNSYFGDGDGPILYSELACKNYESTIVQCDKKEFGSFECERTNVAGITCQDSMAINWARGLIYSFSTI